MARDLRGLVSRWGRGTFAAATADAPTNDFEMLRASVRPRSPSHSFPLSLAWPRKRKVVGS
jgi:hypothetical protein